MNNKEFSTSVLRIRLPEFFCIDDLTELTILKNILIGDILRISDGSEGRYYVNYTGRNDSIDDWTLVHIVMMNNTL